MQKVSQLDRIKSNAPRIALTAFRANPSLGARDAKALFAEIVAHLKAGKNDADAVKAVLENHANNQVPRIALTAFRANPSLGARDAKALFAEIVAHLKAGKNDADAVKAVLENHANNQVPRIALTAFRANPSLGARDAKALLAEIVAHVTSGKSDADAVKAVLENHATNQPTGQLSLH